MSYVVPWIALGISLLSLALTVVQWLEKRAEKARRIDVSLDFSPSIQGGMTNPMGLVILVRNPGYQEVALATLGLLLPDGNRIYLAPRQPPPSSRIMPGDNRMGTWAGKDLTSLCDFIESLGFKGNVTLIGFSEDGLGLTYKSRPLQLSIDDARRSAQMGSS